MTGQEAVSTDYSLEARQLAVDLGGKRIIDIPSMGVVPGEVLAVIGPNGSGKTTLLLSMALLIKPAAGNIFYHGEPVTDALKLRRKFAVVFQEPLLLAGSVMDNVTLGMRLRGVSKEEIKTRARKWLERFGVWNLAKRQAKTLSGGEAKRVSLARAFVLEPEILFLDEPFAALDTPTHQSLVEDFQSVLHETKVSTVMVTHDYEEALILGDRIAVLMNGKIRQMGTPQEVFSLPVDEEVAGFIKAGNILHGDVTAQNNGLAQISVSGQPVEAVSDLKPGTNVTLYIDYENVTISLANGVQTSARNRLRCTITKVLPHGSLVRIIVDCPFPLIALITRRSYEELGLDAGREVIATFKATCVHVLKR